MLKYILDFKVKYIYKNPREDFMNQQTAVLVKITEEMRSNCPFDVLRCVECLSQACKPDPMAGVEINDFMPGEEEED
jgi:hypothetical protein